MADFNGGYILSSAIKIFPCAYRGVSNDGESLAKLVDPESRLNTEYNLTHLSHTGDKKSFIISLSEDKKNFICVVGGYYIEIKLENALANNKKIINIKTKSAENAQISSPVICRWNDNTIANLDEGDYFYGAFFSDKVEFGANFSLDLLDPCSKLLINHSRIESELAGTSISGRWLDGKGNNSVKLGESTSAKYPDLTAIGKYNDDKDGNLFEVGNGTSDEERSNIFEVSNTEIRNLADVSVSGTLDVNDKLTGASGADFTGNVNISGKTTGSDKLTISNGGASITGDVNISGKEFISDKLTVSNGGASITGNLEVSGTINGINEHGENSEISLASGETTIKVSKNLDVLSQSVLGSKSTGKITIKSAGENQTTIIGPNNKTINLPANNEENIEKVLAQTSSENAWIQTTSEINTAHANQVVKLNNSGNIDGVINRAKCDESGNNIKATYGNKLSVSGTKISLLNKNEREISSINSQDTLNTVGNSETSNEKAFLVETLKQSGGSSESFTSKSTYLDCSQEVDNIGKKDALHTWSIICDEEPENWNKATDEQRLNSSHKLVLGGNDRDIGNFGEIEVHGPTGWSNENITFKVDTTGTTEVSDLIIHSAITLPGQIGSESTPIYVGSDGKFAECKNVAAAKKLTDEDGEGINAGGWGNAENYRWFTPIYFKDGKPSEASYGGGLNLAGDTLLQFVGNQIKEVTDKTVGSFADPIYLKNGKLISRKNLTIDSNWSFFLDFEGNISSDVSDVMDKFLKILKDLETTNEKTDLERTGLLYCTSYMLGTQQYLVDYSRLINAVDKTDMSGIFKIRNLLANEEYYSKFRVSIDNDEFDFEFNKSDDGARFARRITNDSFTNLSSIDDMMYGLSIYWDNSGEFVRTQGKYKNTWVKIGQV